MVNRIYNSYPEEQKRKVIKKLLITQNKKCLFCGENIVYSPELSLDEFHKKYEIDHLTGITEEDARDDDSNWVLLHKDCNRKKGKKPFYLAQRLYKFNKEREKDKENFTLGKVLEIKEINSQPILIKINKDSIKIKFNDYGKEKITTNLIFKDPTETLQFNSVFAYLPINYIYHDIEINPRPIGENTIKLIEEFYEEKNHPQLHVCLARIEKIGIVDDYIKAKILLFDGQHKAVAQIYNERKYLLIRIFINGDKKVLKETNLGAHTSLRQIEFYRSIAARVGHGMFGEEFKKYLEKPEHKKSEQLFFNSLPAINRDIIKKEFKGWLMHGILHGHEEETEIEENLMILFIQEEKSRKRDKPISYDSFQKTFINNFVYTKFAEDEIDRERDNYFRIIERQNVIKLMSMIAKKALIRKFDLSKGAHKLEERYRKGSSIPQEHIKAFRIFRPKIFEVWCKQLRDAIKTSLRLCGKIDDLLANKGKIFWKELDDDNWEQIGKMIDRILNHKIWLLPNPSIVNAISSTKKEICEKLLIQGKIEDEQILDTPLDFKYIMGT